MIVFRDASSLHLGRIPSPEQGGSNRILSNVSGGNPVILSVNSSIFLEKIRLMFRNHRTGLSGWSIVVESNA